MTKIISVHLEDELAGKLDALAATMKRPEAWIIEQAIINYVDEQSWQVEVVREALQDYRSGKATLVSHEHVMQEIEELETEIRATLPR
jgi:predicted transcriptional regulator